MSAEFEHASLDSSVYLIEKPYLSKIVIFLWCEVRSLEELKSEEDDSSQLYFVLLSKWFEVHGSSLPFIYRKMHILDKMAAVEWSEIWMMEQTQKPAKCQAADA